MEVSISVVVSPIQREVVVYLGDAGTLDRDTCHVRLNRKYYHFRVLAAGAGAVAADGTLLPSSPRGRTYQTAIYRSVNKETYKLTLGSTPTFDNGCPGSASHGDVPQDPRITIWT